MDTILVIAGVTSVGLVFPIVAAVVAFRKGHKGWGIATIVSIFFGAGPIIGILALLQPAEPNLPIAGSLQGQSTNLFSMEATQRGVPFGRPRWQIRLTPELLELIRLEDKTYIRISKEQGPYCIGYASAWLFGFNVKIVQGGNEYRFKLASNDIAKLRSWVPKKTAAEIKEMRARSLPSNAKPSPLSPATQTPLTFTEPSYWWLWIPVIGWIPFAVPLVIPLGPIMIGFSFGNKIRFIWEAADHNGETLSGGIEGFMSDVFTLGYYSVYRSYKATKKMLAEEGIDTIQGWTPWFLPLYIFCPALVYMPLIRAMIKHWQWHEITIKI